MSSAKSLIDYVHRFGRIDSFELTATKQIYFVFNSCHRFNRLESRADFSSFFSLVAEVFSAL